MEALRQRVPGTHAVRLYVHPLIVVAVGALPFLIGAGQPRPVHHLRAESTRFVKPDGTTFAWRGITAFRLLEFVAHGRERDADRYLRWAASQRVTVVRVLAMTHVLFQLSPAEGEAALDRLLDIAQSHGVTVELVALADTASFTFDLRRHVSTIGAIAARHPNVAIEIANEPYHPTQSAEVHRHDVLRDLRSAIPRDVPVSVGTLDDEGDLAAGDYITWHSPRAPDWPERLREGAELVRRFGKPVIADEPMGAAPQAIPGRRDNLPAHFARAAALCKMLGLGATFHYEGGLQAALPGPTEAKCLSAWLAAL